MKQHRNILLVTAVAWLLLPAAASAQDESAEPPRKSDLEERVGVHLVQIPLVATDKKGRPVTDLKVEELVVKDAGKGREIAYLDWLGALPAQEDLPPARLFVEAPGPSAVAKTPGRDYVALFVDMENTDKLGRDKAHEDLLAFVDELAPGTLVSVVSWDGELHLELPFTGESHLWRGAIQEAFNRHGRGEMDLQSRINTLIDNFSDCVTSGGEFSRVVGDQSCLQQVVAVYSEERRPRTEDFLTGLQDMVEIIGGLPGRKTVLALTHGVAVDPMPEILEAMRAVYGISDQLTQIQVYGGFGDKRQTMMDRLIRFAMDQRVTLHFVDWSRMPAGDSGARRGHALQPGAQPMQVAFTAAQNDIEEIGTATGGVFVAGPDLAWALDRVQDARLGTYELGYYVDGDAAPGRRSKVVVDCKRRGVQVSHRRRHVPSPPALTIPGRIVLGASRPPTERDPFAAHFPFLLQVDPHSLGYRVDGDSASASFTLHVSIEDLAGRRLAESYHFIQHAYPRANWEADDIEWVTIRGWVELPPGGYYLHANLNNTATSAGGQLTTAIEVPAVAAAKAAGSQP